jgi:hypoxanthine phosphoribosyltransferase
MPGNEKRLSWLLFWSKVQQLAAQIDGSDFDPDIVISIGRSGAVVGGMLASLMGAKKHVAFDRLVVLTKKTGFSEERNIEIDPCILPNREILSNKKILGVMSECTSGNTLREINLFFTAIPGIELKTAVIFCKPNVCTCPHFYVDRTEQWPELPFRIEGKWKNYFPRIEKELPISESK